MRLFLSYRRGDSPFVAGRLKDRMVEAFGEENVFYDVDSLHPGVDFRDAIAERLNAADAILAIIGPGWNAPRLQSETDFVRIELEQTLQSGKPLIPVLIAPAQMPTREELPASLKNLAFRNGVPLRPDPDFDTDVSRLLRGLTTPDRDGRGWLRSHPTRVAMLAGGVLAAVVLSVLLIVALIGADDPPIGADDATQTTLAATSEGPASSATTMPATTEPLTSSAPPTTELPASSVTPAPTTVAIAPPPVTTPPGPPIVQSVSASVVRSNGTDSCGNPTQYQPANVHDGQNATAWMAPGDGVGATMTFDLGQPSIVTTVGLIPGYDKFDPCTGSDRFFDLRRVTRVLWGFDDGTSAEQVLVPEPTMQYLDLRRYVTTSRVRMTVLETLEPGDSRLDYTPISEADIL